MIMDYEKKYKEALERAREVINNNPDFVRVTPQLMEEIFPELKKSEDERIRKTIIRFFVDNYPNETEMYDGTVTVGDVIAWLEKQGKEECALKSSKDEDVRKFMEYIEKEAKAYDFNLPNRSYDIYAFAKDILIWLKKQGEQKPKWDDENSKVNDETNAPTEYGKYVDECLNEASKHFFSEGEDKYSVADMFYAGVSCGKSWLGKQGEQEPTAWSEEDEERLQSCINSLQGKGLMGGVDTINTKWLKSIKQRMKE